MIYGSVLEPRMCVCVSVCTHTSVISFFKCLRATYVCMCACMYTRLLFHFLKTVCRARRSPDGLSTGTSRTVAFPVCACVCGLIVAGRTYSLVVMGTQHVAR